MGQGVKRHCDDCAQARGSAWLAEYLVHGPLAGGKPYQEKTKGINDQRAVCGQNKLHAPLEARETVAYGGDPERHILAVELHTPRDRGGSGSPEADGAQSD
jgi:hypothetical protein